MKRFPIIFSIVILSLYGFTQSESKTQPNTKKSTRPKRAMSGVSKFAPKSPNVAPDLDQRLAKYKRVESPFEASKLSSRERQLVQRLGRRVPYHRRYYWGEAGPEGCELVAGAEDV